MTSKRKKFGSVIRSVDAHGVRQCAYFTMAGKNLNRDGTMEGQTYHHKRKYPRKMFDLDERAANFWLKVGNTFSRLKM